MTASLLDGKHVAQGIQNTLKETLAAIRQQGLRIPGLAVILLGDDPASRIYVKNKRAMCTDVGFISYADDLPTTTSEAELLKRIDELNADPTVDGILVQLPLPAHIHTPTILERISPSKDIDGFHPYNLGRLAQGHPLLRPCTPYGIIQLLHHYQIELLGKHAVVIGSSNIVGRPMALEFLLAKATVTMCHSATQELEQHVQAADVIVVATGIKEVIHSMWLNEKQVIVDVGMHRTKEGSLHGDVDFNTAKQRVRWITPVPGGVGPMTIITLLQNTLQAYLNHGS